MHFFELTTSPNVIWMELDGLKLAEGSSPLAIDTHDYSLIGDVTDRFTPREMPF